MKGELSWPQGAEADYLRAPDSATVEAHRRQASLERALVLDQIDEDRRLSAAAAFFMFMFGFGCGAVWTILLSWMF